MAAWVINMYVDCNRIILRSAVATGRLSRTRVRLDLHGLEDDTDGEWQGNESVTVFEGNVD